MPVNHASSLFKKQPGVISLIALILMATITAIAATSSIIIINELRQTESLDQSYYAVYAAETGLEDGLYNVRLMRSTAKLVDAKAILNDYPTFHGIANTAKWQRTVGDEQSFTVTQLTNDQSARVDYFSPDGPNFGSGIESIVMNWKDTCSGASQIESSVITWPIETDEFGHQTITFDPSTQQVFKQINLCLSYPNPCSVTTNSFLSISGVEDFTAIKPYRFEFRPLANISAPSCVIQNFSMTAYSAVGGGGSVVPLPQKLNIKSTGWFGQSQQALTASLPWKAPASGLLNFVLFSQEDIVK